MVRKTQQPMVTAVKVARRIFGLHKQVPRASNARAYAQLTHWLLLFVGQLLSVGECVAKEAAAPK